MISSNKMTHYLSFDQFVTENTGFFLRYGSQKDALTANTLTSAWGFGISANGNIWRRSDDFLGPGYATAKKNDKITTAYSSNQKVLEFFYHYQLWDNLSITPDIQIHKNLPITDARDVIVYGIRVQLDFF